jgi:hypothetical protein
MRCSAKSQNLLGSRSACRRVTKYLLAAMIAPLIASRAAAHIDFSVDCSGGFPCELVPILREEQFLLTTPLPDIFPDYPCLTCPPFVEIFDISGLDPVEVNPPPQWQARVRLFGGDPDPQPNITDSPNLPNLLLVFAGPNDISRPMQFEPFSFPLPQGTTQLQFYAQAFDAQRNIVANAGIIVIPEPCTLGLLAVGAASMSRRIKCRRSRRSTSAA